MHFPNRLLARLALARRGADHANDALYSIPQIGFGPPVARRLDDDYALFISTAVVLHSLAAAHALRPLLRRDYRWMEGSDWPHALWQQCPARSSAS